MKFLLYQGIEYFFGVGGGVGRVKGEFPLFFIDFLPISLNLNISFTHLYIYKFHEIHLIPLPG